MDEVRTIDEYLAAVRAALSDVPARQRDEALTELESLMRADAERRGEQAAIEALGYPRAYARSIRLALTGEEDGPTPQGRILGLPYDFRGANASRLAERIWNPADPRVFMPRLFGVGYTLNFGAIAVKLGLIRPDDAGDESYERIPDGAVAGALAVPAVLAAAVLAIAASAWSALPAEVPIHWGVSGAPDDWAPKAVALGGLVAISVLPVIISYARVLRAHQPKRSRVLAASALTLLGACGVGIIGMTVADAHGGASGGWALPTILAGVVLSFLVLFVPMRLGMRAEWRESLRGHESPADGASSASGENPADREHPAEGDSPADREKGV